ncbi:TPA: hypothetical protein L3934_006129 [Pseudomonas aeruginosa]|uniref:hypothetical protein n=1 Tax=Pseudomonas aeruginosa TaxID=287 RepID=UPI00136FA422|nr:hypothetical protein [Pseudomonas aeruginosa]MXU52377.1 hypothetical protein [Pseudomonas aeruginosa]HBN9846897.1 hypothetical protein [Pseudomonas aeruginosa]HBN9848093.1 hypothetical protein [Pseudomonas aeruginosa]
MDVASISEWLKNSIPGIILLGAIGSIISVILLKYIAPVIRTLGIKPVWYFRKEKMWRYWRSAAAYTHIENDKSNRKLIYYLFRHTARLVLACSAFITTTVVLAIVVTYKSDIILTYGTFILSTLMFLLGYWIKTEYDYITINYIIEWRNTGLVRNPFPEGIDTKAGATPKDKNQKTENQ